MPATIIFKSGWPKTSQPIEANASVGSDGLVTGAAKFLVESGSSAYPPNSAVPASLFKSLNGTQSQGSLYVDQRSLETKQGITTLTISVVGALNPPVLTYSSSSSIGSYSETKTYGDENELSNVFSINYIAETTSVSYWKNKTSNFTITPKRAQLIQTFGKSGNGQLYGPDDSAKVGDGLGEKGFVSRFLTRVETKTFEERSNLEKVTVTQQLVVV